MATTPNTGGYNNINSSVGEIQSRENTHDHHGTLQNSLKATVNIGGKITKELGLQELYTTNTWLGGDHVPLDIPTMCGSTQ